MSPKEDLPALEGITPSYTPAPADHQLPGNADLIRKLTEVRPFVGYPTTDALECDAMLNTFHNFFDNLLDDFDLSALDACVCAAAFEELEWDGAREGSEHPVCRGMPSGLDVASALGHSGAKETASSLWSDYAHYTEQIDALIEEFDNFDVEQRGISLSWTWYSLKALFAEVDEGAPAFMRTPNWSDKSLVTGLAS